MLQRKVGHMQWQKMQMRLLALPIEIDLADHESSEVAGELKVILFGSLAMHNRI